LREGTPDGEQFSQEVLCQCSYLRASAHISGANLPTWWGIYHLLHLDLTCYLATSLICTTIFEGYGFGLFAKLQRYQLLYVVFSVWLFLLIASSIWLRHFRFGPMKGVWRSLTYWRKQPMKVAVQEDSRQKLCAPQ